MDGYGKKKTNKWRDGNVYSDTRIAVIHWLEKEIPKLPKDKRLKVLNISAGNWKVPQQILDQNKINYEYTTFDQKYYGDSKNVVKVIGDVHKMPFRDNEFDVCINNQSLECYYDPQTAINEMYRVLKPYGNGTLLIDTPFNNAYFGFGANPDTLKKKNKVYDYWRITPQGLEHLLKPFSKVEVSCSGPNNWDPWCVMGKAIK